MATTAPALNASETEIDGQKLRISVDPDGAKIEQLHADGWAQAVLTLDANGGYKRYEAFKAPNQFAVKIAFEERGFRRNEPCFKITHYDNAGKKSAEAFDVPRTQFETENNVSGKLIASKASNTLNLSTHREAMGLLKFSAEMARGVPFAPEVQPEQPAGKTNEPEAPAQAEAKPEAATKTLSTAPARRRFMTGEWESEVEGPIDNADGTQALRQYTTQGQLLRGITLKGGKVQRIEMHETTVNAMMLSADFTDPADPAKMDVRIYDKTGHMHQLLEIQPPKIHVTTTEPGTERQYNIYNLNAYLSAAGAFYHCKFGALFLPIPGADMQALPSPFAHIHKISADGAVQRLLFASEDASLIATDVDAKAQRHHSVGKTAEEILVYRYFDNDKVSHVLSLSPGGQPLVYAELDKSGNEKHRITFSHAEGQPATFNIYPPNQRGRISSQGYAGIDQELFGKAVYKRYVPSEKRPNDRTLVMDTANAKRIVDEMTAHGMDAMQSFAERQRPQAQTAAQTSAAPAQPLTRSYTVTMGRQPWEVIETRDAANALVRIEQFTPDNNLYRTLDFTDGKLSRITVEEDAIKQKAVLSVNASGAVEKVALTQGKTPYTNFSFRDGNFTISHPAKGKWHHLKLDAASCNPQYDQSYLHIYGILQMAKALMPLEGVLMPPAPLPVRVSDVYRNGFPVSVEYKTDKGEPFVSTYRPGGFNHVETLRKPEHTLIHLFRHSAEQNKNAMRAALLALPNNEPRTLYTYTATPKSIIKEWEISFDEKDGKKVFACNRFIDNGTVIEAFADVPLEVLTQGTLPAGLSDETRIAYAKLQSDLKPVNEMFNSMLAADPFRDYDIEAYFAPDVAQAAPSPSSPASAKTKPAAPAAPAKPERLTLSESDTCESYPLNNGNLKKTYYRKMPFTDETGAVSEHSFCVFEQITAPNGTRVRTCHYNSDRSGELTLYYAAGSAADAGKEKKCSVLTFSPKDFYDVNNRYFLQPLPEAPGTQHKQQAMNAHIEEAVEELKGMLELNTDSTVILDFGAMKFSHPVIAGFVTAAQKAIEEEGRGRTIKIVGIKGRDKSIREGFERELGDFLRAHPAVKIGDIMENGDPNLPDGYDFTSRIDFDPSGKRIYEERFTDGKRTHAFEFKNGKQTDAPKPRPFDTGAAKGQGK